MSKNLRKSIFKSLGRYLAIAAIIALGSSIFVGLRTTKTAMVATGQVVADQQNMFDLRLLGSYGWTQEDVDKIAALDGIEDAEGAISLDVIATTEQQNEDAVYRMHSLPHMVSQVSLRAGRMPQSSDECLADGFTFGEDIIGTKVTLSDENDASVFESMSHKSYTVVGIVSTPLYMDRNRGGTNVGNGKINTYFYIPEDGFQVDYFTEIGVTIPGKFQIYSNNYNKALESAADQLQDYVQSLADDRLSGIKADAESEYSKGYEEYLDGSKELNDKKTDTQKELDNAYQELSKAEKDLANIEKTLSGGEQQLNDAKNALTKGEKELSAAKQQLAQQKTETYTKLDASKAELDKNAAEVESNLTQVNNGLSQIDSGLSMVNQGITQLEVLLPQLDSGIKQLEQGVAFLEKVVKSLEATLDFLKLDPETNAVLIEKTEAALTETQAKLESSRSQLEELKKLQQTGPAQLQSLYQTKAQLEAQRKELLENKSKLEAAQKAIAEGYTELEDGRAAADAEFSAAEAKIAQNEAALQVARSTVNAKEAELLNGKTQLADGKNKLADGWNEYKNGKAEFDKAIQEGEAKLSEAESKLAQARADIDALKDAKIYILDRNTNIGYASLDSNSDIVAGVSKIFPLFFLLVASLVCITTMTRMVSEERTQIGTLKALGYSNGAIISKYLFYAGSSAVLGCTLGVIAGSIAFPVILWKVYSIMLYIRDDVVIRFDWPLCITVVIVYTIVMLLATWYSCHKTLQEKPADLIRPKPPTSSRKILLERFPFWRKISFLNKVSLRNIFRYRQRLAMMLIGIGGCTALLVTGYGIRDSIANIADYQYEDISVYDMEVYFADGQSEDQQNTFMKNLDGQTENVMFFHQSNVKLNFEDQTRDIALIAADQQIQDFFDFHKGKESLEMPGPNEVLLSVGMAKSLGIRTGDSLTLRNADMQPMTVTVSSIFDNNVGNYAIVLPETVESQWGTTPEKQMAYVTVADDSNIHDVSAAIAHLDNVMNVSVNEDNAALVHTMMKALDLVVITVVFCAAALAVIVVYNLTNINITERIREIATIKVLGFNAAETASYVFKENLALTLMGALIGLVMGNLLLRFVISQITVDIVWFQPRVTVISYVIAFILTLVSAMIVNFIFYFKLDKINMAEALKSVE